MFSFLCMSYTAEFEWKGNTDQSVNMYNEAETELKTNK